MPNDLILGCGFLGLRLARTLLRKSASSELESQVYTLTRSEEKAERLRDLGMQVRVADINEIRSPSDLPDYPLFRSITICIGNDSVQQSHSQVYSRATNLATKLARLSLLETEATPTRIHFVSTTGVYSDVNHSTTESSGTAAAVDESWPCAPKRPGSIASYECEESLRTTWAKNHCVFRLAGIYATSRIPNLANLKAGKPLSGSGEGWLNLIHVDDAADILALAITDPPERSILNVSDGHPIRRGEFYRHIASHFNCPEPSFDDSLQGRGGTKQIVNDELLQWHLFPFRKVSDPSTWNDSEV